MYGPNPVKPHSIENGPLTPAGMVRCVLLVAVLWAGSAAAAQYEVPDPKSGVVGQVAGNFVIVNVVGNVNEELVHFVSIRN